MSNVRQLVQDSGGLARQCVGGDLITTVATPLYIATDANRTLTVADISQGVLAFTGFTTGRTLTTDTAVNILAAAPLLNIGEAISVQIGISTAFAGTLAAGTGVTLKGKAAVPASSSAILYFIKTSATTVDCLVV